MTRDSPSDEKHTPARMNRRTALGALGASLLATGTGFGIGGVGATDGSARELGGFASTTNSTFSQRHDLPSEAGDFGHEPSAVSRFTFLDLTVEVRAIWRFTRAGHFETAYEPVTMHIKTVIADSISAGNVPAGRGKP